MTEPTARERARAITWSHASAPWSQVEHEIEQAILAAEQRAREPFVEQVNQMRREFAVEVWKLESQVAALREALGRFEWDRDTDTWGTWPNPLDVQMVLVDTAASAEAYTARIREKALEEALDEFRLLVCAPDELPQEFHAMIEKWFIAELKPIEDRIRALATPPATEEAK